MCVRGSWRQNRTAIYWPPLLWPSALYLSRSPDAQPEAWGLSFLLAFSTTSCLWLLWSPTHWESLGPHRPGVGFPTTSLHQLPVFLSSPSYIIVLSPTQSPTQSLEWHVWSPSSGNNCHAVQRSLSSGASVYECIMGFYFVSQIRLRDFFRLLAIGMCHFLLVHHFKMACFAGSKVNIQQKALVQNGNMPRSGFEID